MGKQNRLAICLILVWSFSVAAFPSRASGMPQQQQQSNDSKLPYKRRRIIFEALTSTMDDNHHEKINGMDEIQAGRLEVLKQKEAELAAMLSAVRREKLLALRSRPLTIGVVGFGRFGQFIAKTFAKHGNVVVTSRSDYTAIAESLGVKYVPLSNPEAFVTDELDVIVVAVSILSFASTIQMLAPYLQNLIDQRSIVGGGLLRAPLIVDVLSVKEHARNIMLEHLPTECDILCAHPMFGPDSGKDSWSGLNFVFEKTRIDKVVLHPEESQAFVDEAGGVHSIHEDSDVHVEGVDRMERFLSIWEEEGCRMVSLSCADHDAYAANSQFITHLVGRVLGSQGLQETPIDTSGFQSVLQLIGSTTADSFDLFYGLYKYNKNSLETIRQLQGAMNDVVQNLRTMEQSEINDARHKNSSNLSTSEAATIRPNQQSTR